MVITTVTSTDARQHLPARHHQQPRLAVTVPVLTPALTIVKTASAASATPGQQVTYTITVTDTGQTPYTGAVVTDDLTGLLDDAAYGADAAATSGAVSYASPVLTWTGNLTPGQAATITYTVTVDNPETGDNILTNTVTSAAPGSNCPAGSTDPRCASTVPVATLTIVNTANVSTTTPGGKIDYTITITNTGQIRYDNATVTDDLTAVTDDGVAFGDDAATTAGSVSYVSPDLTWTGDLEPGQSAIVTFSVTVNNPDTGDKTITSTLISTDPGSTCPPGGPAPACTSTVTVLIPALTITKTASTSTTTPGSTVGYTITVTDTGPTPYTGATVTDSLDGVLSDAAYNNDATATSGAVSYASPDLTWTGNLNPGDAATITYTVTVTDDRGFGADWTATVSASGFATGAGTPAETIPAADAQYNISALATATGSATFTPAPTTQLSASPQPVVSATNVAGNTTVTWDSHYRGSPSPAAPSPGPTPRSSSRTPSNPDPHRASSPGLAAATRITARTRRPAIPAPPGRHGGTQGRII